MSRGKKGKVTQKPQFCKLDLNNWQWLQNQPNKNRTINNCIYLYRTRFEQQLFEEEKEKVINKMYKKLMES